ncbi:hypothetical protein DP923_11830 [Pontibacter arcticus]|uniref:Uncharacterized protein n=2 Tax=Pontibacter arcticus TaxID=2080288 RepID=A0A364RDY0_9BACT|nr:hypothetical protein DP923_11830 [Pontibacter arcticus]
MCCKKKGNVAASKERVGGGQAIQKDNYTCVSNIRVELVSDGEEAPDALVVSFTSMDTVVNQILEQGKKVTVYVWKDSSETIEDSAAYSSRIALLRRINDNEFQLSYPDMGFRFLKPYQLSEISSDEFRKKSKVKIKTKSGKEWIFRSCQ